MATPGPVISVGLPNCREGKSQPPGSVTVPLLREFAIVAERLGYDGLWPNELMQLQEVRPAGAPNSYFDPIVMIGHLSAVTERIRFVTATIILPHHHPILLSRQVATLDACSGGRVTLGIGLGGVAGSFRQLRADLGAVNRGAMMDEYLEALRLLWERPRASYAGKYVSFTDAEAYPKPSQQPLPILMAGGADGVVDRIARFGQGWIDSHTLPRQITDVIGRMRAQRAAFGIPAAPLSIARQFYVSLAPTAAAARSVVLDSGANVQAGVTDAEERRIIGTPEDVIRVMAPYLSAGVTELCPIFYGATLAALIGQLQLFAREVMPTLRAWAPAFPPAHQLAPASGTMT